MEKLKKVKIKRINIKKNEDVYDLTIKDNHNFFANNILVHNCGEVPLSPYDSCRLGSINLAEYVTNEYQTNAKVDWKGIEKISRFAQRVMDDVVDLEDEKIGLILDKLESDPESDYIKRVEKETWIRIRKSLLMGRRTGIGVLGLGDMLAKLGVQYASTESLKIIDKIFKTIATNVYIESINLAKERGSFSIWSEEKEQFNPFISRIKKELSDEELNDYSKYGRRNIASLSIAPTGSLAIEAKTTSGIEPVFMIKSIRRRKINTSSENSKVDYVDSLGDKWEEYIVFHSEFLKWAESYFKDRNVEDITQYLNSINRNELEDAISKSPWKGSESHDIDYINKVKMQGIIQKWIDHSISITHNLPKDVSKETVNEIYFEAWKSGCKGCTIYREGSRAGVILSEKDEKKNDEFIENHAPKRPKSLKADYYVAKSAGREFAVIIGLWTNTNKPYEIFAFENPPRNKNCQGEIVKVRKGQYMFISEKEDFKIESLELAFDRKEHRTLTLTASMLLRHGAPIEHVNNVIKKIDENITSFASVVRRYLSRYVEKETIEEKCPNCGGDLIREEGCMHCTICEYSRC